MADAFCAHYLLSLRYAIGNEALVHLNARLGLPPADGGILDAAWWLVRRPGALAQDPFGVPAAFAVPLWTAAAFGIIAVARRRPAFCALLVVPVATAFTLTALRIMPLYGRFALWLVPPTCVALAVAAQVLAARAMPARVGEATAGGAPARARLPMITLGLVCAVGGLVAIAPGVANAARTPPVITGVDDRAAMSYLRAEHRPGDLVVVTPSSWPAVDWYADFAVLAPLRVALFPAGSRCRPDHLSRHTRGFSRILAWSGARTSVQNMDQALAASLSGVGRVVQTRRFHGGTGVLYVVDLTAPPPPSRLRAVACVDLVPHRR